MKNLFCLLLMAGILFTACKKGDTGPIGLQGTTGTAGVAGPAGKDGSVIWSGTVAPAISIGKEGDYYLNSTNDSLYGPKVAAGWAKAISLKGSKGETGAAGAAGSQILSGDGTPPNSLGDVGDYYLDKTNYLLYGPKFRNILTRTVIWGAGLQLGAPVQTYRFTNPFNYTFLFSYGLIQIPYSSFNYTPDLGDNSLSLIYLKYEKLWFPAYGEIGFQTAVLDARYNFDNTDFYLYLYINKHNGVVWTSSDDFKTSSGISEIKIIVVPAGKITIISAMQDKSYAKVMEILKTNK